MTAVALERTWYLPCGLGHSTGKERDSTALRTVPVLISYRLCAPPPNSLPSGTLQEPVLSLLRWLTPAPSWPGIGLKSMCLHPTNVATGAHSHRPRGRTEKEEHGHFWANLYFTQNIVVFDICLRCAWSYISGNLWFITNLLWSWRRAVGNRRGKKYPDGKWTCASLLGKCISVI